MGTKAVQELAPQSARRRYAMRAYLNFEKEHIELLLHVLSEAEEARLLSGSEQYVQMILQEALDNIDKGM